VVIFIISCFYTLWLSGFVGRCAAHDANKKAGANPAYRILSNEKFLELEGAQLNVEVNS